MQAVVAVTVRICSINTAPKPVLHDWEGLYL